MFRESTTARTLLRAVITTILAFLGALGTALTDGEVALLEWVVIANATVLAFGGYLGVGAVTVSEPFFGSQHQVEVPVPPAEPDDETTLANRDDFFAGP